MKVTNFILPALAAVFFFSCEKDGQEPAEEPVPASPALKLNVAFTVDGSPLEFDTIKYENAAHNIYSVNTLVFYLSQISLIKDDQSVVQIKDWVYVDARTPSTLNISMEDIPKGCYSGIRFNCGIDSIHNIPNGLIPTPDNLMMEWPVAMGGGYHFLKLEGYFSDSTGTPGYAMHIGTNACLTSVVLPVALCFEEADVSKTLSVNINEWFRTPSVYDFNIDGNYIMGNTAAMMKFAVNGTDAFNIQ